MTQTEFLRCVCNLVEDTLSKHGLPLKVTGGECLEPGHVRLELPCPANGAVDAIAARTGAHVTMTMHVDVKCRTRGATAT